MGYMEMAKAIEESIIKWRRELHQIPETENNLPKTSKYVQDRLTEMGIPFKTMVNGSGVLGIIEGGKPGKTVALRADMDALPVAEEAPVAFKSTNGCMHACGHDAHASMLLGAAKILNDQKADLCGNIKLIFQPGEENPGGAKPMIEEGALENPKVDAVFGQHIGSLIEEIGGVKVKNGQMIVSYSRVMASRDNFWIKIKGRGAHSSTPHLSIDPVAIAAQVINSIYTMKSRELPALSPSVISICTIHGGTAANIIPEEIVMEGSTRSVDVPTQKYIAKRIEDIVKSTCEMAGATYEFEYIWGYPVTENNREMAEHAVESAKKILPAEDIIDNGPYVMGSEDMSYYLNEVPGAYFFLTSYVEQDGMIYGHHNPKFMLDESVFVRGTALFCQIATDFLNK